MRGATTPSSTCSSGGQLADRLVAPASVRQKPIWTVVFGCRAKYVGNRMEHTALNRCMHGVVNIFVREPLPSGSGPHKPAIKMLTGKSAVFNQIVTDEVHAHFKREREAAKRPSAPAPAWRISAAPAKKTRDDKISEEARPLPAVLGGVLLSQMRRNLD